jgi:hypothetical protein
MQDLYGSDSIGMCAVYVGHSPSSGPSAIAS